MIETLSALQKILKIPGAGEAASLPKGGLGAVLAHAGIGKTALMVQLALREMSAGGKVLHISLEDPLKKVDLWYRELLNNLIKQNPAATGGLSEELLANRFIMIFKVDGFTAPKLEERLSELIEQNIFSPDLLIIDGLHFDGASRPILLQLKDFAARLGLRIWFTVHTHRYEEPLPDGMIERFSLVKDLFSSVFRLSHEDEKVLLIPLQGIPEQNEKFYLDPSTLLVNNG